MARGDTSVPRKEVSPKVMSRLGEERWVGFQCTYMCRDYEKKGFVTSNGLEYDV